MKRSIAVPALVALAVFVVPYTVRGEDQGSGAGYQRLRALQGSAQAALDAGKPAVAAQRAAQLLRENTDKASWNYGNIVYDANQIRGLAALKQGDVAGAERCLLAAGNTPGSPQLDSFGPDLTLAQALADKGRTQTVLTFLNEISRFWGTPRTASDRQFLDLYKKHAAMIAAWKTQIKAGKPVVLDRYGDSGGGGSQAASPPLLADGAAAPDFTVQDRDGHPVKLSDYKGKIVVLDFWATWCGPCQASLPHTNSVARIYKEKGVVVLAVNVWDTPSAFKQWLPAHKSFDALTFAIDPTQTHGQDIATRLYHVSGIPTQYVIGPDGAIVKSFVGYVGPTHDLAAALDTALGQSGTT